MPAASLPTRLHTADLVLIVVYLIGITLFGLRFRESKGTSRSLRSYFLADRSIPWWAIALSIVSAETSTLTIISIPGIAFGGDFGFLQLVIGYMIGRIVVALIFLPRYFQGEMLTAYQLIDRRFGPTLHRVTAGLFLITRAAAEGVRVFAVSIVVSIAIGSGDILSIGLISALTLLYTFEGGMAAVIWTDVVQMFIYVAGTLVAIFTLGAHVPGGWAYIHTTAAAAGKFHLFNFAFNLTQTYTFWAGVLGGTFLTMASHGTDQLMVQRMLAARNLRESRIALLSSGVVIFFQFTLFLLIGAGLYVFYGLYPQLAANLTPDRLFPTFIVREMPIGIAGLLIAAILAAAMSNLSAALNSLSSTTVVDFYMRMRPEADDRERMMISRSSTVLWALILFAVAVYSVFVGGKGHVVEIGLSIASVAYGALLGVFLLGTLTKFVTQTGAIIGMVCGFALNMFLWLQPHAIHFNSGFTYTTPSTTYYIGFMIPKVAFTWYVLIGSAVTFAIGCAASLLFRRKPTPKAAALTLLLATLFSSSFRSEAQPLPSTHAPSSLKPLLLSFRSEAEEPAPQTPAPNTTAAGQLDFTPISTAITEAIAQHKLPGAVVLIGHDNKIVFEQAYGDRKIAGEPSPDGTTAAEPMTEDTIFDMASLTKCLVTATAIMQLYEQHKLDLDAPVAQYLPDFAANGKQNVTVRELLTHYSGLPPDLDLKDPWGLTAPDKAEAVRRAMNSPLDNPPGTKFVYSDINFITLGLLVEKLSGEPLELYAQRHIFGPLLMGDTTYHAFSRVVGPHNVSGSAIELHQTGDRFIVAEVSANPTTWGSYNILRTAPTAHDDEGTPETNPDYNHLLRGTVHDPTTRRMGGVAGHAGVFSTAHDISLFAQALLTKLLTNTGPFPLEQSTLRLMTTPQQPATARDDATIFLPGLQLSKGVALRGIGWDINTAYSRPRGALFPLTSFGHTGFTGTSLWIDPTSDTYVILLANAIHPHVGTAISPLRAAVATEAARALNLYKQAVPVQCGQPNVACDPSPTVTMNVPTLTGVDVLESTHFEALLNIAARHNHHLRIGLLTNQSGLDSTGHRTIDILLHASPELTLTTLFSPEHGIAGARDDTHTTSSTDPATHLPVISLYGPHPSDRRPSDAQLANLDAIVIDLQDAGVRFYTYPAVVGYFLEVAARRHIEIVVLDRPNPIGGVAVQGPISDPNTESYNNYMPLPVRHGMTLGELARFFNTERRLPTTPNMQTSIQAQLTVIPMQNWTRDMFYDNTHFPWTNPSPNIRSLNAAILYPAIGMIEQTNISVGRGTDTPFEHIGAPWINSKQLADYLTARHIPGVDFTPTTFAVAEDPNHYPFHGQTIPGITFTVTDRAILDSPELGVELASALHTLYPQFELAKATHLVDSINTMHDLENHEDPRKIAASWSHDLADFTHRRQPYLLYQ